jgi:hypothetical protein
MVVVGLATWPALLRLLGQGKSRGVYFLLDFVTG